MPTVKLPSLVYWREGRPRFIPGPNERKLGFKGEDLRHGPTDVRGQKSGAWFTFEEATAWGVQIHEHIGQGRAAATTKAARQAAERSANRGTIHELLDDWIAAFERQVELGARRRSTLIGYKAQLRAIRYKKRTHEQRRAGQKLEPELFARMPVSAVQLPEFHAFCQYHIDTRGLSMGRLTRAVLQAAWGFGMLSTKWRLHALDFRKLRLATPKARVVIYSDAEIRALCDAALAMPAITLKDGTVLYRRSIATGIMLGLFTGQRQGDRLTLEDNGLVDNRHTFRQSKTGAIVAIPETPELAAALEAARIHNAAVRLAHGTRPTAIMVDEATGNEYKRDTYGHTFARVRRQAAKTCPTLAGKWEMDLRDTAITWLARAGADVIEISSVSGHSLQSIHLILKHYLAMSPEFADSGIAKLIAWMEKTKVKV
jgi:hypothetical protein